MCLFLKIKLGLLDVLVAQVPGHDRLKVLVGRLAQLLLNRVVHRLSPRQLLLNDVNTLLGLLPIRLLLFFLLLLLFLALLEAGN